MPKPARLAAATSAALAAMVLSTGASWATRVQGTEGPELGPGGGTRPTGQLFDSATGGPGADTIWGQAGPDDIFGDAGDDVLNGGSGDDALTDVRGRDSFRAGSGDDQAHPGPGPDVVHLGRGDDTVFASSATDQADTIDCGPGSDTLRYERTPHDADVVTRCERIVVVNRPSTNW